MPNPQLYLDVIEERKPILREFKLRPYQKEICDLTEQSVDSFNTSIAIEAPTGAGKSAMIAEMARRFQDQGVVIAVNITALIDQISEHLTMFGVEHSILKAGYEDKFDPSCNVQLVMTQTLHARLEKIKWKKEMLYWIQDEGHREFDTPRTTECLKHVGSTIKILYSATPYDNQGYMLKVDDLIRVISMQKLIDQGYLAKPRYYVPKWSLTIDYSDIPKGGTDYSAEQLGSMLSQREYADMAAQAMIHRDISQKKTIVFCSNIEHADAITEALKQKGIRAMSYHSDMDKSSLEANLELFKGKEPTVLVSVSKISIGFDVKDIQMVVMLRPTLVRSLWVQSVGRGARIADGKTEFEVLDLAGCLETHGFAETEYIPPVKKEELVQIREQNRIDVLRLMVKEEPTEVTLEAVKLKIEEVERKKHDPENMRVSELVDLFEYTKDHREVIKYAFWIAYKVNQDGYMPTMEGRIQRTSAKWDVLMETYPESRNMILKSLKTRAKNVIKNKKKIASLFYFADWFEENALSLK